MSLVSGGSEISWRMERRGCRWIKSIPSGWWSLMLLKCPSVSTRGRCGESGRESLQGENGPSLGLKWDIPASIHPHIEIHKGNSAEKKGPFCHKERTTLSQRKDHLVTKKGPSCHKERTIFCHLTLTPHHLLTQRPLSNITLFPHYNSHKIKHRKNWRKFWWAFFNCDAQMKNLLSVHT